MEKQAGNADALKRALMVKNGMPGRYGNWPSGTFGILYEKMADKNAEIGNGDKTARRRYNEVMREFDIQLREVKKGGWDSEFSALSKERKAAAQGLLGAIGKQGEFEKAALLFEGIENRIDSRYNEFEAEVREKIPEMKIPRIKKIGPENLATALEELNEIVRYMRD